MRLDRLTRRMILAAGLGLAAAPAHGEDAAERPRVSQAEAQYRNTPYGLFSCAGCTFFIKPRSCKVVTGDISPHGWCKLFDLPD